MTLEVISKNAQETMTLAKKLAETFSAPVVIVLSGDLGAGKTTFTKGFALGLGVEETVTSPTFTLMNQYTGKMPLYHFDMYRLSNEEEALAVGFEEYFDLTKLDGVVIVEWAENVGELVKKPYIKITLEKISDEHRRILIEDNK